MTVAAVILARSSESALSDVEGQARVRRVADAAWSGGALPIVVVAPDPDGGVAAALAGASVTLAEPAPMEHGPAAQMARGIEVATSTVRDVDGALLWPVRFGWVSPETVTSLIEAHGIERSTLLRPTFEGEEGWPVLVPTERMSMLDGVPGGRMPNEIVADLITGGLATRTIELGDPGTTHDTSVPRDELPPYSGPLEPAAPHTHEWGAGLADSHEESPLAGPALAPYGQAASEDPDQPG